MTLESIGYILEVNTFHLVVLIHCGILIPESFLWNSSSDCLCLTSVTIDHSVEGSTVWASFKSLNTCQGNTLFVEVRGCSDYRLGIARLQMLLSETPLALEFLFAFWHIF